MVTSLSQSCLAYQKKGLLERGYRKKEAFLPIKSKYIERKPVLHRLNYLFN